MINSTISGPLVGAALLAASSAFAADDTSTTVPADLDFVGIALGGLGQGVGATQVATFLSAETRGEGEATAGALIFSFGEGTGLGSASANPEGSDPLSFGGQGEGSGVGRIELLSGVQARSAGDGGALAETTFFSFSAGAGVGSSLTSFLSGEDPVTTTSGDAIGISVTESSSLTEVFGDSPGNEAEALLVSFTLGSGFGEGRAGPQAGTMPSSDSSELIEDALDGRDVSLVFGGRPQTISPN